VTDALAPGLERRCPTCGRPAEQLCHDPTEGVHFIKPCGDVVKVTPLPNGGLLVETTDDARPFDSREKPKGLWTPGDPV
jgi:hypothetical protein